MAFSMNRTPEESTASPEKQPQYVSIRSDISMHLLIEFKKTCDSLKRSEKKTDCDGFSSVSQRSKGKQIDFSEGTINLHRDQRHRERSEWSEANSEDFTENRRERRFSEEGPEVFYFQTPMPEPSPSSKRLEEKINVFVKKELERFQNPEFIEEQVEEEESMKSSREAFQTILLNIQKTINEERLADGLERKTSFVFQAKLKARLKKASQNVFEGIGEAGKETPLNSIFTDLYMTEEKSEEVRRMQNPFLKSDGAETEFTYEDLFGVGREEAVRTVMTKGVAGIGKTVLVQKFTLDWAEDKANRDVHFTFPFKFRELNVLKGKKYSLVELVDRFFGETEGAGVCRFEDSRVVFIFDGLDECQFSLDFHNTEILTDVTTPTSLDVLLTNLFRGKLLPSAHVWITTRPAAASQIPPECVDVVTEIRGFTDSQKEEYFRKRFPDERQFGRIMSHIETSRSLHIMCHIPVFCWITATVLEHVLNGTEGGELPKTLTEMYVHFLVFQATAKKEKYDGEDPLWSPESRELIKTLGKLAFEQLQKGNFNFNESHLKECGIDVRVASVCSGVFTQIFREERGLYLDSLFCFVHLSVQEFLAALHVHMSFANSGVNLLEDQPTGSQTVEDTSAEARLYQCAVDQALQSPNGHLDLFLRFLLGLSLPANQRHLQRLLTEKEINPETNQETIQYIKTKMNENPSPEKCINLFHCLNELNDHSLEEEIQWFLKSGRFSTSNPSSAHWSALVVILLSSGKDLDVFDLKRYSASEEAFLMLLPVVKASNRALLGGCNLSAKSCAALSSLLSSPSCCLREVDLSNNDLEDSGVQLLSVGLRSPHCRLETLRLSGCLMTNAGCAFLNSALTANPSHLKELDVSCNHLGKEGVTLVSALQEDPRLRLDTLSIYPTGAKWLTPGLKKYACKVILDPNTANRHLYLYENNTKIMTTSALTGRPDHEDRYDAWPQVRGVSGLTGRCYWEVEWENEGHVAVTYKPDEDGEDSCFGMNKHSWCLACFSNVFYAWHNKRGAIICPPPASSPSGRVGVYLDWQAGTLSFYSVSSQAPVHLHTFYCRFTDSLFPGFGFWDGPGAVVSLCEP